MTTLSLAMIVKNEEEVLERCLSSCIDAFDEVIIVDTGSTDKTMKIAQSFGKKVHIHHFDWVNDFSAARNFSFSKCTSDYIMWLDADDILFKIDLETLLQEKEKDFFGMDGLLAVYEYAVDSMGNSIMDLERNRIVKRSKNPKWHDPIHEFLDVKGTSGKSKVKVHHRRTAKGLESDGQRNLAILSKLVEKKGPNYGRNLFYYAKELSYFPTPENRKKMVEVLEEYIHGEVPDWIENKKNGWGLLAEGLRNIGELDKSIEVAREGCKRYPDVIDSYLELGYSLEQQGKVNEAIEVFQRASKVEIPNTMAPISLHKYKIAPHIALSLCYSKLENWEKSFSYNYQVLKQKPDDLNINHNVKYILDQMISKWSGPIFFSTPWDENFGPDRIRYGNLIKFLQAKGLHVELYEQKKVEGNPPLIHRYGRPLDVQQAQKLGYKVILDVCEDLFDIEGANKPLIDYVKKSDLVVCCSETLRERTSKYNPNAYTIEDALEVLEPQCEYRDELNVVGFFGYGNNYRYVKPYEDLLHKLGLKILAIHEHEDPHGDISIKWERDTWAKELQKCDVVFLPASTKVELAKSNNRLTQAMALGYPTIVTPRPSSSSIVNNGVNAYLLREDLEGILHTLRPKEQRVSVGKMARKSVSPYRQESIFGLWLSLLNSTRQEVTPKTNLGILPITGFKNVLLEHLDYPMNLEDSLGINSYIHGSYFLEHYKQEDVGIILHKLSNCLTKDGKLSIIFTDFEQAIEAHQKEEIDFDTLSRRAFQNGQHRSIISLDYIVTKLKDLKFEVIKELDLCKFPHTIVPNPSNPIPEPLQRGIIAWKKRSKFDEERPHFCLDLEEEPILVDCIIPIYNQLEYTKATLDSIRTCTLPGSYKLILVDAGSEKETKEWLEEYSSQHGDTKLIRKEKASFAQAINLGIEASSSPYLCFLNNDVIVSKGWVEKLVSACKGRVASVGPWSNCDYGWKHQDELVLDGLPLVPDMRLEQFRDLTKLYDLKYSDQREVLKLKRGCFNAFYCTMMKRGVVNEVGLLDEAFQNGGEDADWCYRAQNLGYDHINIKDCFIFHFGGKTRKDTSERSKKEEVFNTQRLNRKWNKKRVAIFTGGAWEKWDPDSIDRKGIGGSETAAIKMCEELSKLGCDTFLFGDHTSGGQRGGFEWIPFREYPKWASMNHVDTLVVSRLTWPFDIPIVAKKRYCWVHDIWISNQRELPNTDRIDKFLCLSPWHREFFGNHHQIDPDKILLTENGIETSYFEDLDWNAKDPYRFIYSSSPDRGLDCLLDLWPSIMERYPQANLHVFYGFYNWQKSLEKRGDKAGLVRLKEFMDRLNQPGVTYHDRVGQRELAEWYKGASVWLMPEPFTETNCITAKEAMAGGCYPICSDVAALKTTVGDRGTLIHFEGTPNTFYSIYRTPEIKNKFLEVTYHFLDNRPEYEAKIMANREEMMKNLGWSSVAKSWFETLIG